MNRVKWNTLVVGSLDDQRVLSNTLNSRGYSAEFLTGEFTPESLETILKEHDYDAFILRESTVGDYDNKALKLIRDYLSDKKNIHTSRAIMIRDDTPSTSISVREATRRIRQDLVLAEVDGGDSVELNYMLNIMDMARSRVNKKKQVEVSNKILVLEDNQLMADAYTNFLHFTNPEWEIEVTRDLDTAVSKLRSTAFGVAILDKDIGESRMDVRQFNTWLTQTYPYCRSLLVSGKLTNDDITFFNNSAILKPGNNYEFDLMEQYIRNNFKIRQEMLKRTLEDSSPRLWLVGGHRGAGKTTVVDQVDLAVPFACKAVKYMSRGRRSGEVEGKDVYFVDESKILDHRDDPNWINYELLDTAGKPYHIGIDLLQIDDMLADDKDVLLILGEPQLANRFYERFAGRIESVLIYMDSAEVAAKAVERRDDKEYTAERILEDHARFRDFREPHIYINSFDPFNKSRGYIYENAVDIVKRGSLDRLIRNFTNDIIIRREHKKNKYINMAKMGPK